jgi:hypothetical protein
MILARIMALFFCPEKPTTLAATCLAPSGTYRSRPVLHPLCVKRQQIGSQTVQTSAPWV